MEFEDWEYITEDSLLGSQNTIGEKNSSFEVVDVEVREITEVDLQSLEGTEEDDKEFEFAFEEESSLETESWGSVEVKEAEEEKKENEDGTHWRWRMRGMGAVRSVGIAAAAAATLSMYVLGGCKRNQNRLHGDAKKTKQGMEQEANMNQSISNVRGTTTTTSSYKLFDGYFHGF